MESWNWSSRITLAKNGWDDNGNINSNEDMAKNAASEEQDRHFCLRRPV